MNRPGFVVIGQRVLAVLAVVFGAITIFAGFRVLTGVDPGYVVLPALLIYNTVMGFVYFGVGVIAWRSLDSGKIGACAIFVLNVIVLAVIGVVYTSGGAVAIDSLYAMTLRTVVWLGIFAGLWWLSYRNRAD